MLSASSSLAPIASTWLQVTEKGKKKQENKKIINLSLSLIF
jgi:hypothetical protein